MHIDEDIRRAFAWVEVACNMVFAIELVMRFYVQCAFLLDGADPLFLTDVAVNALPPVIDLALRSNFLLDDHTSPHSPEARWVRLLVLFRVLKLVRHYDGALALAKALQRSASPLLAPLFFTGAGTLLFAGFLCVIEPEGSAGEDFETIPEAMYFSVITLTTVGYGDVAPQTTGGRAMTAVCAILAVLFMAMPLTIV
eukprot:941218-Prymnesium_polylepis.1